MKHTHSHLLGVEFLIVVVFFYVHAIHQICCFEKKGGISIKVFLSALIKDNTPKPRLLGTYLVPQLPFHIKFPFMVNNCIGNALRFQTFGEVEFARGELTLQLFVGSLTFFLWLGARWCPFDERLNNIIKRWQNWMNNWIKRSFAEWPKNTI